MGHDYNDTSGYYDDQFTKVWTFVTKQTENNTAVGERLRSLEKREDASQKNQVEREQQIKILEERLEKMEEHNKERIAAFHVEIAIQNTNIKRLHDFLDRSKKALRVSRTGYGMSTPRFPSLRKNPKYRNKTHDFDESLSPTPLKGNVSPLRIQQQRFNRQKFKDGKSGSPIPFGGSDLPNRLDRLDLDPVSDKTEMGTQPDAAGINLSASDMFNPLFDESPAAIVDESIAEAHRGSPPAQGPSLVEELTVQNASFTDSRANVDSSSNPVLEQSPAAIVEKSIAEDGGEGPPVSPAVSDMLDPKYDHPLLNESSAAIESIAGPPASPFVSDMLDPTYNHQFTTSNAGLSLAEELTVQNAASIDSRGNVDSSSNPVLEQSPAAIVEESIAEDDAEGPPASPAVSDMLDPQYDYPLLNESSAAIEGIAGPPASPSVSHMRDPTYDDYFTTHNTGLSLAKEMSVQNILDPSFASNATSMDGMDSSDVTLLGSEVHQEYSAVKDPSCNAYVATVTQHESNASNEPDEPSPSKEGEIQGKDTLEVVAVPKPREYCWPNIFKSLPLGVILTIIVITATITFIGIVMGMTICITYSYDCYFSPTRSCFTTEQHSQYSSKIVNLKLT